MVQRRARTKAVPTIEDWAIPTDNLAASSTTNSAYISDPMIEDTPQPSTLIFKLRNSIGAETYA
jgi:hypothetical protein